jgi:hypothetical protein
MTTYRKLHVRILESADFQDMPDDFTRLTWTLLMLVLDRDGRALDNLANLRAKIYPLREDVTPDMLKRAFDWYAERGLIVRYQVEGKRYFYQTTFQKYQGDTRRESASIYPEPPTEQAQPSAETTLEQVVSKTGVAQVQVVSITSTTTTTETETTAEAETTTTTAPVGVVAVAPVVDIPQMARIGRLVEDNFGLSASFRDLMKEAIEEYGADALEFALQEKVLNGGRTWKYVLGVMENRKKGIPRVKSRGNGHSPPVQIAQSSDEMIRRNVEDNGSWLE